MKADSPPPKLVKFGMATDESERIVERHFDVTDGLHALAGGVLAHNLRVADIVHAKLNGEPVPRETPMLVATVAEPTSALAQDLRAQLGLT